MPAYYNEIDPKAAQWLRNLIAAGLIAVGEVDNRSIVDVHADDVRGFDQVHLFAGIGVWSYAPHIRQRLYFVAYDHQLPVRSQRRGGAGRMADTDCVGLQGRLPRRQGSQRQALNRPLGCGFPIGDPDPLGDFWRGADWLYCRDQRYRPVEPGTFPLADGAASRVVRLRAYGNAIVAPLAAEFIRASMRCIP